MIRNHIPLLIIASVLLLTQCSKDQRANEISSALEDLSSFVGDTAYLDSPYVTAGDRLYMVGHQDGSFPDLGWHVEGEMGGIWNHPIKLMDGFALSLREVGSDRARCLDDASRFINFPVGNQHIFATETLSLKRSQFVPDGLEGLVVELEITNQSNVDKELYLGFTGLVDLMPVWLSDSLGIEDGSDAAKWDASNQVFRAKDNNNPWFLVFGSSESIDSTWTGKASCSKERKGRGLDAGFRSTISIAPGQTKSVQYYIAGSYKSEERAWETYQQLRSKPAELLANKKDRYRTLKESSDVSLPDTDIQEMYTWLKYNTDWLIRDVAGVGRGVSAGIPDYPWWFAADNAYTLQGLLATGQFDEVKSTLDLLYKLSDKVNGNGRVIHEASTNGVVYNKGNMNETPHIIYLLWKVYTWTGEKEFLTKYYEQVQKGIEFLLTTKDEDGNGYPNGHGMMEIRGLDTEMIDVAVYTQQALWAAAKIAGELNRPEDQDRYQAQANELLNKINEEWWVDEFDSYADFRATRSQTLNLIDDALIRADTLNKPWAVNELQNTRQAVRSQDNTGVQGYVVHHNWVVNTPMEMAIADSSKAKKALATAREYTSRFGMYVTGIDRDERREESNKWEIFSYVGAVMTLPTGVQAVAEANYGNIEESYKYIKMLSNSFGYALPGSMYEVSPDYGMMVQAWNLYAAAVPIVEHYFGIKPRAYEQSVTIQPRMPADWKNVTLSNVKVGDNSITVSKTVTDSTKTFELHQKNDDWNIELKLPTTLGNNITINGEQVDAEQVNDLFIITLNGNSNTVIIEERGN